MKFGGHVSTYRTPSATFCPSGQLESLINNVGNDSGRREWREHWPIVAASMLGLAISQIHLYSMGVMIAPLEAEFHWSRTEITSGLLIVSLVVCPLSPIIGLMIDRVGPKRIALWGILVYCSAIAALSLAQQPIWTWWLVWLSVAFGHLLLKATVWLAAISSFFDASRGMAIAVVLSASGFMAFGAPFLTSFLVETVSWRMTYMLWGGVAGVIAFPMLFFFFTSARDQSRAELKMGAAVKAPTVVGLSLRESLKSWSFVKLAMTGFIMTICGVALIVNLVPILISLKIDASTAAALAGFVGISQILGRLSGGFLLDQFNARLVGAATLLFPIISCALLIQFGGSVPVAAIAIFIFGLAIGAEMDVIAYISARLFGTKNFGALYGIIVSVLSLGNGLGPVLASVVYDFTGSYKLVLWGVIPVSLIGSVLLLSLGPYPEFNKEKGGEKRDELVPAT